MLRYLHCLKMKVLLCNFIHMIEDNYLIKLYANATMLTYLNSDIAYRLGCHRD